jgi:2-amino-4-hydroxy-6-hydroxymethyldihydropteridine diphosphokinase
VKFYTADAGTDEQVAAIGFGSNLGQSRAILTAAWRELGHCPGIAPIALSSPYRSQPLEMISDNWFVNAAALVRTTLSPEALLRVLQAVETRHGRRRDAAASAIHRDRTLDLDLLLYDDLLLATGRLIVPHPRLAHRLFVLAPLAEIAADLLHPGCDKMIGVLLTELRQTDHNQLIERIAW